MKQLSLRTRSVLFAIATLAIFTPATVFTLESAYTTSLTQAKMGELRLMNLGLLTAFELDGDMPYIPEILYEEQLNLPDSGYLGLIVFRDTVVWQSASALNFNLPLPDIKPGVGNEIFLESLSVPFDTDNEYFAYAFTAEFASSSDFEPVQFYIYNNKQVFNEERRIFLNTTWQWLIMLSTALVVLLIFGVSLVLSPVRNLIAEISQTARGEQKEVESAYPKEFDHLKSSINLLIHTEAQQRSRYKNSLGDLAHSLKTPLAVAFGSKGLPEQTTEALTQIDKIIQRQLKRASAGQAGWQKPIAVFPLITRVIDAMDKVYQHKQLVLGIDGDSDAQFKGDETDLMELMGNLLDNACKASKLNVLVTVKQQNNWLEIYVDDDGPGIPENKKRTLLKRGERLDTYEEGQGIGMAVVSDLVAIYGGQLHIDQAPDQEDIPLGGARIVVRFPI
ncbi:ATP-binding protein [Alteromonas sp. KUL49]|uniref:ATP-binding protein n=1 Tax=Alteromonas sp. KUL49 TaxID=2480798 RepID=UPI00102EE559|nr:ATP-binding protein [Alteromonas sp. KUL49]TAP40408.1 GHKL domain-containing protein [Alteromonas sp. KUL49]GEA11572.1 two-component sensor histidine kinase [Alteromonas sp. KUL49]